MKSLVYQVLRKSYDYRTSVRSVECMFYKNVYKILSCLKVHRLCIYSQIEVVASMVLNFVCDKYAIKV